MLTPQEKAVLHVLQRDEAELTSPPGKFALGNILVASGQITRVQLESALLGQRASGRRLGEELIDAGHASKRQVEKGLLLQKKLIAYALVLATTLVPFAPIIPTAHAAKRGAAMPVSAMVIGNARLQISYQAKQINISAADVARGEVEVPGALRFSVVTNKGSGYLMQFHPVGNFFASVHVDGLGNTVQLGADGGAIVQRGPQAPDQTHELGFRFNLHPDTTPGSYPWPLMLSVRGL
jgi:hypothetical protein